MPVTKKTGTGRLATKKSPRGRPSVPDEDRRRSNPHGGRRLAPSRPAMSSDHLIDIEQFDADLWKVADELRANSGLASNEYFMPIMGLLFPAPGDEPLLLSAGGNRGGQGRWHDTRALDSACERTRRRTEARD